MQLCMAEIEPNPIFVAHLSEGRAIVGALFAGLKTTNGQAKSLGSIFKRCFVHSGGAGLDTRDLYS